MKSAVAIRERWVAGKVIGTTVKLPAGNHTGKRAKRRNITSDMVRKNNDRLAERNLTMLIDANFGEGDGHYTLTYAIAPTQKQAAKDIRDAKKNGIIDQFFYGSMTAEYLMDQIYAM